MRGIGFGRGDTGFIAEADEFGNGCDPEFLHYPTAVDLDRFLGNIQLESDLLVQIAAGRSTS